MSVSIIPHVPLTEREPMPGRDIIAAQPQGWTGIAMSEWVLDKAEWIDRHPHLEVNYVLEGELHVESGGQTVVATAGDTVVVEANAKGRYYAPVYARMLAIYGPNPDGAESDSFAYKEYDG